VVHLNIDLKSADGAEFMTFMGDKLKLQLNNDAAICTTSSNTCVDGVVTPSRPTFTDYRFH
jgi:hypothetical protein